MGSCRIDAGIGKRPESGDHFGVSIGKCWQISNRLSARKLTVTTSSKRC